MMLEASLISVRAIYRMTRTFAIVALRASHIIGYGLCIASASFLKLTLRASTNPVVVRGNKSGRWGRWGASVAGQYRDLVHMIGPASSGAEPGRRAEAWLEGADVLPMAGKAAGVVPRCSRDRLGETSARDRPPRNLSSRNSFVRGLYLLRECD